MSSLKAFPLQIWIVFLEKLLIRGREIHRQGRSANAYRTAPNRHNQLACLRVAQHLTAWAELQLGPFAHPTSILVHSHQLKGFLAAILTIQLRRRGCAEKARRLESVYHM